MDNKTKSFDENSVYTVLKAIALVGLDGFYEKDGSIDLKKVVDWIVQEEYVTQKEADLFEAFVLDILES
jgi:hypothetical protein